MARLFHHYVPSRLLLLGAAEAAIVFASVYAGLFLPLVGMPVVVPARVPIAVPALVMSGLVFLAAYMAGLYDSSKRYGRRELLLRLALVFLGAYLAVAILGYLVSPWFLGRKAYLLSFLVAFPLTFALRLAYTHFTSDARHRKKVLLLGTGWVSQMLNELITNGSSPDYTLIGSIDGNPERTGQELHGARILGTMTELDRVVKRARPDVIVVALEERRGILPLPEIVECKLQGIEVEDWPSFYEKATGKIPISHLRPSWLVFSDGFKKSRLTLAAKRAMDIAISLAALILTLPLIAVIAVLIKLDSLGPVFFRQQRLGQYGRPFTVIKFRSMRVGADRARPAAGPSGRDPRVTRVGRSLRRTRLDELPQLFNVLAGQMSLVGPRPEWTALAAEFQEKVPFYLYRLAVKPGISGWAQVKNPYGASVENTLEKLQYDLYYIKNMSIFLDLLILLHTIQIVLFTRGSEAWTSKPEPASTTSVSYAG